MPPTMYILSLQLINSILEGVLEPVARRWTDIRSDPRAPGLPRSMPCSHASSPKTLNSHGLSGENPWLPVDCAVRPSNVPRH